MPDTVFEEKLTEAISVSCRNRITEELWRIEVNMKHITKSLMLIMVT